MPWPFEDLVLGLGNSFGEYLRVPDVIASDHVMSLTTTNVGTMTSSRRVGRLSVTPADPKLKILRQVSG
ncbi:MAG TPA: hypothetical protein VF182_16370 [Candidatus Binatia bacterium]